MCERGIVDVKIEGESCTGGKCEQQLCIVLDKLGDRQEGVYVCDNVCHSKLKTVFREELFGC